MNHVVDRGVVVDGVGVEVRCNLVLDELASTVEAVHDAPQDVVGNVCLGVKQLLNPRHALYLIGVHIPPEFKLAELGEGGCLAVQG